MHRLLKYHKYIALILFLLALWLPAMHLDTHASKGSIERWNSQYHAINVWHGWQAVLMGMPSLFWGIPAWLANPAFIYGLLNKKLSVFSSFIALACASTSNKVFNINFPADEAGINVFQVGHFSIGFYIWFAAIIVLPFGYLYNKFFPQNS